MFESSDDGATADGIAREAKLTFFDLTKNGGLSVPLDKSTVYGPGKDAGALIHNNSWGSYTTDGAYTLNTKSLDDYVVMNKHHLLVFAAGNYGDESQSEQGAAKNVISG